jgi:hypothetical protein
MSAFGCSKRVPALNADLFTSVTPGASFDSHRRNHDLDAVRAAEASDGNT